MAIGALTITETDVVAGQSIFASTEIARNAQVTTWANDQVVAKTVDKDSVQTITGKKTFSGGLDAGSKVLSNVLAPVANLDAATKKYVDDLVAATVALKGFNAVGATVEGTNVHNAVKPITYEELDLSSVVLKNPAKVTLRFSSSARVTVDFRTLGESLPHQRTTLINMIDSGGIGGGDNSIDNVASFILVEAITDSDGKIEWRASNAGVTIALAVVGYVA